MPFTKGSLEKLTLQKIRALQIDINNPESPTCSESKLKFALCQIYGLHLSKGIRKNIKAGLETIFDVWLTGKKPNGKASDLLSPETFADDAEEIKKIAESYIAIPKNERNAKTNVLLGFLYFKPIGVTRNIQAGLECFKKAADDQKFPQAQFLMGEAHFVGYPQAGILKDNTIAIEYLQKSAEQNFPRAQYQLGLHYFTLKRIEKDLPKAVFWFSKAHQNGLEDALPKLEEASLELKKEMEMQLELEKQQDLHNFDNEIFTQQSEISPKNTFKRDAALMLSANGKNAAEASLTCNNHVKPADQQKKLKWTNNSFKPEGTTLYIAK